MDGWPTARSGPAWQPASASPPYGFGLADNQETDTTCWKDILYDIIPQIACCCRQIILDGSVSYSVETRERTGLLVESGLQKTLEQGGRFMARIPQACASVNAKTLYAETLDKAWHTLCQTLSGELNALLVAIASHVVGRPYHVRREQVSAHLRREGTCCRCGSSCSQLFSRNGFRNRQPLSMEWGEWSLELPRVRCECGGSVKIDFGDCGLQNVKTCSKAWMSISALMLG